MTVVLDPHQPMSCSAQLVGSTMHFMSPEFLISSKFGAEEAVPTPEADIYTFGLAIFQVCEVPSGYLLSTYTAQVLSGTWYFSNFFWSFSLCFFICFIFFTIFSLGFTLQEKKAIRVLLKIWRSRTQRTTTTDDPFQGLSKRPSLWVVLQVHLPFIAPLDLPQQDVPFFTR